MDDKTISKWTRRFPLLRRYLLGTNPDDDSDFYHPELCADEVADISVQKVDAALLLRGPLAANYTFGFLILGTRGECEWLEGLDEEVSVLRQCDDRYYWDTPEGSCDSSDDYPMSRTLLSRVINTEWSLRQIQYIVELREDLTDSVDRWVKITIHKWDARTFSLENLAKTHLVPGNRAH